MPAVSFTIIPNSTRSASRRTQPQKRRPSNPHIRASPSISPSLSRTNRRTTLHNRRANHRRRSHRRFRQRRILRHQRRPAHSAKAVPLNILTAAFSAAQAPS
jgi:hypothetical protein